MVTFENPNPTDTEQELFRYAGFYKIEDNENCLRYVTIHTDIRDNFPKKIEIEPEYIEYDTSITFFHMSETVDAVGSFDGKLINLINARMKELGWEL